MKRKSRTFALLLITAHQKNIIYYKKLIQKKEEKIYRICKKYDIPYMNDAVISNLANAISKMFSE